MLTSNYSEVKSLDKQYLDQIWCKFFILTFNLYGDNTFYDLNVILCNILCFINVTICVKFFPQSIYL